MSNEEIKPKKKKNKVARFFVKFVIVLMFLGAGAYALHILYHNYQKKEYQALVSLTEQEIVRCAELVSIKAIYSDVIAIRKSAVFGMAKSLSLIKYTGTIRAGIKDIRDVSYEISPDRKSIVIRVPHATILANDITNQEVFDEINNVFVPITTQNVFTQIDSARKKQELSLIKGGFLTQADEYTAEVLKRVFSAMRFESVTVELQKRDVTLSPEVTELLEKAAASVQRESAALGGALRDTVSQ